jgi:hypothetical protein
VCVDGNGKDFFFFKFYVLNIEYTTCSIALFITGSEGNLFTESHCTERANRLRRKYCMRQPQVNKLLCQQTPHDLTTEIQN